MKALVYSPYLPDHFGGGERYIFDVVSALQVLGYQVVVTGSRAFTESEITAYETFLGRSLSEVVFEPTAALKNGNWLEKLFFTRNFDVVYYLTDGSLFFSLARRNILHVQVPITVRGNTLGFRLKKLCWQVVNTNSDFTRKHIESHWPIAVNMTHHPVIDLPLKTKSEVEKVIKQKEKIILSVGRFFTQLHAKRQDVMVAAYKELFQEYKTAMKGWKLVLIGVVEDEAYAASVAAAAAGFPIEMYHNVTRDELESWYRKAAIYWHAAGYEIEEEKQPERVEHFGISTAEAMSWGEVPCVVGKGGQVEVLGTALQDLLWQDVSELKKKTYALIKDEKARNALGLIAWQQAQSFNRTRFVSQLKEMLA